MLYKYCKSRPLFTTYKPKIVVLSPVIMHSYVPPRTSGELLTLPEPRDDQAFWTSAVVTLSLYGAAPDQLRDNS